MSDWEREFEEEQRRRRALYADLVEAFPYMFRRVRGEEDFFASNPAIREGWAQVFKRLCHEIDSTLTEAERKRFRLLQVKQKFGGLRVYWQMGAPRRSWVDIQTSEGVFSLEPRTRRGSAADRLKALVAQAAAEAAYTCEICGRSPAKLVIVDAWLTTLCDSHIQSEERGT